MKLSELFEDDLNGDLVNSIKDILIPFVAAGVPFVTIDQIVDSIRDLGLGMAVDNSFVMNTIDPQSVPAVKRISGGRVYLSLPDEEHSASSKDQKEKDQDKIKKDASKKALDNIKKKGA